MSLTLSGPNRIGIAPGEKYSGWRDAMDGLGWVAGKRYPKAYHLAKLWGVARASEM